MKPFVFAHRGASGYEIENTIPSFKKAINMGAGIETDLQLTKDDKLICFHDPCFKVGNEYISVRDMTYKSIKKIKFKDGRKIPLIKDIFQLFSYKSKDLHYSFDIANKKAGFKLLRLAEKANLLNKIAITDRRLIVLSLLRKRNREVKLIHTLLNNIEILRNKPLNVEKLYKIGVYAINLKCSKYIEDIFKNVIDNGFKCYIWGVNTKINMKKVIKLKYKNEIVDSIYTDYPDVLLNLIINHFK
jgi:glycerophosphoryl diester phosphodiesterase